MTQRTVESNQPQRVFKKHIITQGTHFIVKNGKLEMKELDPNATKSYKVIPYNHYNKPVTSSEYDQETIKKLNQEIEDLKAQRRDLLDLVDAERRKNQILYERIADLDEESRILKEIDQEEEEKKTARKHMYRQFMYSQGEVRKIRLDYEKRLKKMEKLYSEEIENLNNHIEGLSLAALSQMPILNLEKEKLGNSRKRTSNTEEDELQTSDKIESLKPLCLKLDLNALNSQNKAKRCCNSSFDLELSENGKSNPSTARKILKSINDTHCKISPFQVKNKQNRHKRSQVKTARTTLSTRVQK